MRLPILFLFLFGFGLASVGAAQQPLGSGAFSVELRGELASPTGAFADDLGLGTGYGLGVAARVLLTDAVSLYGGWDRFAFRGTTEIAGFTAIDRGFRAGAQLTLPTFVRLYPFLTGGATYSSTTVRQRVLEERAETDGDRGFGYEVGGGLMIPIVRGLWLVPESRYRSRSNAAPADAGDNSDLTVSYLSFNLGVTFRLPN